MKDIEKDELFPGFNLSSEPSLALVNDSENSGLHTRFSGTEEIAPTPALGRGVSSMTGELHGDPAKAELAEPTNRRGTPCYIAVVESEEDLAKTFRLRASASFKSLGFKASASLEYFRSRTFHRYTLSIVALVNVYVDSKRLMPVELREPALLRAQESAERYYSFYADQVVREVVYGGSLLVVFDFDTQTAKEAEEIKVALGFKARSFSASVETKSTFEEIVKKSTFVLTLIPEGAKPPLLPIQGATKIEDDEKKKEILEFIASYPDKVSDTILNVVAYSADPASEADNWPDHKPMDLSKALRTVEDLAKLRRAGSTLKEELSYVLAHEIRFEEPNFAAIKSAVERLEAWLITIDRAAQDVIRNPWADIPGVVNELEEFRKVLPKERDLLRPLIVAEFQNDRGAHGTITVNLDDNLQTGWIGPRPGSYSPLINLRLKCQPPLQDAYIVTRTKANHAEGTSAEWDWALPSNSPFYQFGIGLEGPGAKNYSLEYSLHIADFGDRGPYPGDLTLRGETAAHGIQSIRVQLKPI